MALTLLAVTTEEVAAAVAAPTGHLWLFFSQVPLAIYFVVSLRDIPLDLAIQRLCTCYGLPLGLLVAFSYSPLYGVLACALLWYLFTHSVPFAPIRLPSGQFRQFIWRAVRHSPVAGVRDAAREEPETNLFAVSVYVKMVLPLVNLINKIGDAVSPPRPKRTLAGSEVSWLFLAINAVDRFLHRVTRHHILIPVAWRAMQKRAKSVRATPEINNENDETLQAVALFLGDLDKSVVGVSATGRLLINNLVVGMLDLRAAVQRYLMNHPEVLHVRAARRRRLARAMCSAGVRGSRGTLLLLLLLLLLVLRRVAGAPARRSRSASRSSSWACRARARRTCRRCWRRTRTRGTCASGR